MPIWSPLTAPLKVALALKHRTLKTEMSFPSDIKSGMKDCMLKIFWPKDQIVKFLSDNGCTKKDIKILGDHKQLHRHQIIDQMFSHLSGKPDGGIGAFRAMLQSLTTWTYFDPYYFENLKKLKKSDAQSSIEHLKQLQEIRDHKIKQERKARAAKEAATQNPKETIADLKSRYISLIQGSINAQKRGYELERILLEMAKLSKLEITEPFKVQGEQIDGSIKYDGEHYLVEAKWQDKAAANEPVYQFAGKIDGKMYGRGIFVSVNGFSTNVMSTLTKGKAIHTIFIDGEDIMMVLEERVSFSEMLNIKVKSAQTKGEIYVNVLTGNSKIS